MPLVLNYRFTFIDAEDDEEAAQGVHLRRALTPPPPRPGQMSHLSEVAHSEELEVARCRDYLNGLMSESGLVDSGDHSAFKQMSDGSKDSNDATVDAPNGASEQMSVGSLGHPIACRRPCVHMMKHRQCLNGSVCGYCHFPHPREVKLDREQRAMIHQLPYGYFLRIVAEMLKTKAGEVANPAIWDAVHLLEEEAEMAECVVAHTDVKAMKKLKRGLKNLNVLSLLSLVKRRCQDHVCEELTQIASDLRLRA
mmetsp:Transcript_120218/g.169168  ORF Transcript_120218/g.169168 Transcript_120218/m.169168 type:complete len:252 (-) Transcript_120218:130-885(-)